MLRKLMKYEFRATGRIFLPMYAALIIIAGVNRLLMSLKLETPSMIGTVVSVILIIGIFVLTIILAIQRFNRNLLSNEGYLMMTLPVKTDSIILSKLFAAAVWAAGSFAVVMLALFIMAGNRGVFLEFESLWISWNYSLSTLQIVIYLIELAIIAIISIIVSALLLYTCISLSMLVNKRRGLFAFGAFVVITTVLQILLAIGVAILRTMTIGNFFNRLFGGLSFFGGLQVAIVAIFICEIVMSAVFYLITRHMLKNRLNLQ